MKQYIERGTLFCNKYQTLITLSYDKRKMKKFIRKYEKKHFTIDIKNIYSIKIRLSGLGLSVKPDNCYGDNLPKRLFMTISYNISKEVRLSIQVTANNFMNIGNHKNNMIKITLTEM
ncbi:MAG: hypothetical protein [Caudoviricetes sp.]|nr:MAG: hypothetical protein [Caudoviricetes sp.]